MVFLIGEDVIVLAADGGDDAEVGLEAGRERHDRLLAEESGQFPLELRMQAQRAVEEPRAGAAGAEGLKRLHARGDHARMHGQPEIIVGAEHDAALSLHDDLGVLPRLQLVKIRVDAHFPRLIDIDVFRFCKQIHWCVLPPCWFGRRQPIPLCRRRAGIKENDTVLPKGGAPPDQPVKKGSERTAPSVRAREFKQEEP